MNASDEQLEGQIEAVNKLVKDLQADDAQLSNEINNLTTTFQIEDERLSARINNLSKVAVRSCRVCFQQTAGYNRFNTAIRSEPLNPRLLLSVGANMPDSQSGKRDSNPAASDDQPRRIGSSPLHGGRRRQSGDRDERR